MNVHILTCDIAYALITFCNFLSFACAIQEAIRMCSEQQQAQLDEHNSIDICVYVIYTSSCMFCILSLCAVAVHMYRHTLQRTVVHSYCN
jgi:hypothetical protein